MNPSLEHVESPTLRALLRGEIAATPDLVRMAVDLTWLQNEYSERCDGEDFEVDRWEEMQAALERASDALEDGVACLAALRDYWTRWERFSSSY
jgi:hypothetical protein